MIRRLMFASLCMLALAAPFSAQQPDMAAMQRWMAAKHVTWHIVGKYEGDPAISSDSQGLGHVTDAIELDVTLDWQNGNTIVGAPAIKNAPATVTNLRDREPKCLAPTLSGAFDYATLDAVTAGVAGGLHFTMTRTYPAAVVSQVCSSTKPAPAKKTTDEQELFVPQPTFLAMGMSDANIAPSADKKSVIVKNAPGFTGWSWTMTPTPR
jgi:hypothetical protein